MKTPEIDELKGKLIMLLIDHIAMIDLARSMKHEDKDSFINALFDNGKRIESLVGEIFTVEEKKLKIEKLISVEEFNEHVMKIARNVIEKLRECEFSDENCGDRISQAIMVEWKNEKVPTDNFGQGDEKTR